MNVGCRIKYRWGACGIVVKKLTLNHIVAAEGEQASIWGDKPYLHVRRDDGSMFFVPEIDCEVINEVQ